MTNCVCNVKCSQKRQSSGKMLFFLYMMFVLVISCKNEEISQTELESDIRLNTTHCVISESDQEPIVVDAKSLELFSQTNTIVMEEAAFYQNRRNSEDKNISGKAKFLRLDTDSQDVYLEGGVELFIHPDEKKQVSKEMPLDNEQTEIEGKGDSENADLGLNKITAETMTWGKYSKKLESMGDVSLEWEGTVIRGKNLKGNLNSGEFTFDVVYEGKL